MLLHIPEVKWRPEPESRDEMEGRRGGPYNGEVFGNSFYPVSLLSRPFRDLVRFLLCTRGVCAFAWYDPFFDLGRHGQFLHSAGCQW